MTDTININSSSSRPDWFYKLSQFVQECIEEIRLRAWTHPTTGQVRIYANNVAGQDGRKIFAVKDGEHYRIETQGFSHGYGVAADATGYVGWALDLLGDTWAEILEKVN